MKLKSFLVTFLLLSILPICAQNAPTKLWGTLVDAFTRQRIKGEVKCSLLRTDSTVMMTTKSFENRDAEYGEITTRFNFMVPKQTTDKFLIKLEAEGYETVYKPVKLIWKSKTAKISLWNLSMRHTSRKDSIVLGEATVTATKIKFYTKDDTIVYNADAFQLQEGSMLDGLIASLPGAELKPDGQILVNGKKVESLLLNGRDFFKGDNTILLDNLPAYMVHQVQVYNKESETSKMLGRKTDEGMLVMDVKLKKQYSIGWLANTEWGGGTEDRYLGRLFAMRYTNQSRLTLYGNINNVNDRRKPDGNGNWSDVDPSGGLTTTRRGGMDYNIKDKRDRYSLWGSADVNYTDNNNAWSGSSTDFYPSGDVHNVTSQNTKTANLSITTSHKFQFNNKNNGNNRSFSLTPNFKYYKNNYDATYRNGSFSAPFTENYTAVLDSLFSPNWTQTVRNLIKRNREESKNRGHGMNGSIGFWSFINLPYTSDALSVEANVAYGNSHTKGFNHFEHNFYRGNDMQTDFRNRYDDTPSDNFSLDAKFRYIWHWNDYIMLIPNYSFGYSHNADDQMHYRLDVLEESEGQPLGWLPSYAENLFDALDNDNSYQSTLRRYSHNVILDWQMFKEEYAPKGEKLSCWYVQIRPALMFKRSEFDFLYNPQAQQIGKRYWLPKADILVKRNTRGYKHTIMFNANLSSSEPTMMNLIDKIFTNNSLNLSMGNPNLKQQTRIDVTLSYNSDKWLQPRQQQFYANGGWNITNNAIAISRTYDKATGTTTSRPDNINGNWDTWAYIGFNTPIDKKRKLTLNMSAIGYFHHRVDFSNDDLVDKASVRTSRNIVHTGKDLKLTYRYKKISFGLSGNIAWHYAKANHNDFSEMNAWDIRYGANAIVELPWHIQFSTELTMFSRRGYESDAMNRNDLVWNARLSKNFLKNSLVITLDAWDILGNLSNVLTGINSYSRWERYVNVIPRYAMLRLAYRLNKQPKKK